MILLVTCKIPSCGLLTIKALSEKDELHDMMSIKSCRGTAMDLLLSPFPGSDCKHQISGASELLTLGFLSPTSSCNEGKKCQEPHSVLAGWDWWDGIIWGSCIVFGALERNFCHCKNTSTYRLRFRAWCRQKDFEQEHINVYGRSWRLSVIPRVESSSSFPMSLSSCSSASWKKKRTPQIERILEEKFFSEDLQNVSTASWLLDKAQTQSQGQVTIVHQNSILKLQSKAPQAWNSDSAVLHEDLKKRVDKKQHYEVFWAIRTEVKIGPCIWQIWHVSFVIKIWHLHSDCSLHSLTALSLDVVTLTYLFSSLYATG